jgi:hypothetical protein
MLEEGVETIGAPGMKHVFRRMLDSFSERIMMAD